MGFFSKKKKQSASEMKAELDALRSRRENEEYDRKLKMQLAKEKRLAKENTGFGRFSKGVKKAVKGAAQAAKERNSQRDNGLFSGGSSSGLFGDDNIRSRKKSSKKKDDDIFDKWGIN